MKTIFLATCAEFPDLWHDDQLLLEALNQQADVTARSAIWDDDSVDWAEADLVMIRSVWDYHLRRDEFLAWIARIESQTQILNPPSMIRWNSHKGYLRELRDKGIAVIPTIWGEQGRGVNLESALADNDWEAMVIKPAVSASAMGTKRFTRAEVESAQAHLDGLLQTGDAMIQPFIGEVADNAENSLMFVDGVFTHAVERSSALFTSDGEHSARITPTPAKIRLAENILSSLESTPLYARVDVIESGTYGLVLLELELIEPELFLRYADNTVQALVEAIQRLV